MPQTTTRVLRMSSSTTILIHGANRGEYLPSIPKASLQSQADHYLPGLGRALAAHYLLEPNTFIAAAVRNPSDSNSQSLLSLPKGQGSSIILVKLDSLVKEDFKSVVDALKADHSIKALDPVVSSAGIVRLARVDELDIEDLKEHVEVNALGPVRLFQATLPLLKNSKHPKFFVFGSMGGSIGQMDMYPFPQASYLSSKAMLNSLIRKVQMENPWLIALTVHPEWAQTEMGNNVAMSVGLGKAPVTVHDSIAGVVAILEKATNKTVIGPFLDYEGKEYLW